MLHKKVQVQVHTSTGLKKKSNCTTTRAMKCADGERRCADESVFLGVAFYDFIHVRTCV